MTSQPTRPSWVVQLGWAVLLTAASTGLRAALIPVVGGVRFLPYVPAVLAATLLGGTESGLAVTLMAAVLGVVWAPAPPTATTPASTPAVTLLFLGTALGSVWLCSRVRRARVDALVAAELVRQADLRLRAAHDLHAARTAADLTVGQLTAVFDSMSEGMVVADAAGNLLEWNPAALKLHGYAGVDEVRRHLGRFAEDYELSDAAGPLPPEQWPMARVLRGERFDGVELTVHRRDADAGRGRTWVVAYSGTPVRDADGRLALAVVTLHDVTAERRAQADVRQNAVRLALALEAGGLGDWEWDAASDAVTLSPAAARLFGVDGQPAPTRASMLDLLDPADRDRARHANAVATERRTGYAIEYRVARPDGSAVWVATRGRGEYDAAGRLTRMHGVVQDVTAQKTAEQQRETLLAAAQAAKSEAEHASRMKDEFLSTISHELRTPLNAMLGWTQILRAGPPEPDDIEQGLTVIERNARAQAQIIEDLLDMSRIISGKVRLEVGPLDVVQLTETAVDTVRPTAEAKGVRLVTAVVAPLKPCTGDAGRVQQVLWNLLTNAIKFTPAGGQVTLAVAPVDGHVQFTVADTGEGISPEFMPHIFGRFRQADGGTTRKHGGLGLGLSIVKQLAELHGGTATAASRGKGHGATFTVTLPTTPAATPAAAPEPAPSRRALRGTHEHCATLRGVRLLVVDDEPDARGVIGRLLRDCDAAVTLAGSAAEAVGLLETDGPFDCLVSDIGMPGEDGYALLARVRAMPQTAGLPAVALTAYARAEDRTRALAAGFQAHLTKPVEPADLVATVAGLVGREAVA